MTSTFRRSLRQGCRRAVFDAGEVCGQAKQGRTSPLTAAAFFVDLLGDFFVLRLFLVAIDFPLLISG